MYKTVLLRRFDRNVISYTRLKSTRENRVKGIETSDNLTQKFSII